MPKRTVTIQVSEYKNRGICNLFTYLEERMLEAGMDPMKPFTFSSWDFFCFQKELTIEQDEE